MCVCLPDDPLALPNGIVFPGSHSLYFVKSTPRKSTDGRTKSSSPMQVQFSEVLWLGSSLCFSFFLAPDSGPDLAPSPELGSLPSDLAPSPELGLLPSDLAISLEFPFLASDLALSPECLFFKTWIIHFKLKVFF